MTTALKLERIKAGKKQFEIANKLGISPTELSLYETGRKRCPRNRRYELARILEVSVDILFPEERSI